MISLVEALNYRCLRYISQPLGPFHVLIGPNASGKTTFLDVIAFLGRLVSDGPDAAVEERTSNFQDLVWGRKGRSFELAIVAEIPENKRKKLKDSKYGYIRYEVSIGLKNETDEVSILKEKVLLMSKLPVFRRKEPDLFPFAQEPPKTIFLRTTKGNHIVIHKAPSGKDLFYKEDRESGKSWDPVYVLGSRKSALANVPPDESLFPVSNWFKEMLKEGEGVQQLILNSQLIRKASPPGKKLTFKTDGSNLPFVVNELQKNSKERFGDWLNHLRTALPDLENIKTIEMPDNKYRYLVICYRGGLEVPSWTASDGTLRLLALTVLAYLPDIKGIFLIEEPENGIHPIAIETMYQSLQSVYNAQVLIATHSPVILKISDADKVLCFAKTDDGGTDIVLGSEHPRLRDWMDKVDMGDLFVGGVLG